MNRIIEYKGPCVIYEGERSFVSAVAGVINAVVHINERYKRAIKSEVCFNLMNTLYFSFADQYKTMNELKEAILNTLGEELLPEVLREIVCQRD